MGSWAMTADSFSRGACRVGEVTDTGFTFDLVLTRDSKTDAAWVTLAGHSREGTFDGQYLVNEASATRTFPSCSECDTLMFERIEVAVLSSSQSSALGSACPDTVLEDGGVPAPNDAGITGPGQTALGFDAARLCGFLTTRLQSTGTHADGGDCAVDCSDCEVKYKLRGDRR